MGLASEEKVEPAKSPEVVSLLSVEYVPAVGDDGEMKTVVGFGRLPSVGGKELCVGLAGGKFVLPP